MATTGISRPEVAAQVLTESTIISYLGSRAFTEDLFPAYRFFLDVHSQRERRPLMTCARSSASRLAIKE